MRKKVKYLATCVCGFLSALIPALLASPAFAADTPAFVSDLTTDYMNGNWDAVESALKDHAKEIPTLPAQQRADVTTISSAFSECHQSWWKLCKGGKKFAFRPVVWNRRLDADYQPTNTGAKYTNTEGQVHFDIGWDPADMESSANGEHGFTKGEIAELSIWMTLGSADAWPMVPISSLENTTEDGRTALTRFVDFRSCVTGACYGSPRVRRWALFLYLNTYLPKYNKMSTQMSREAVGAMFLHELLANPAKYPSIKLPKSLPDDNTEEKCAGQVKAWIERHPWTLAEDQSLRDMLKRFATANSATVYKTATVVLPDKLSVALDPEKDKPLAQKRDAWIKSQLQKNGADP